MSRLSDLVRFYEALQRLEQGLGGCRRLADLDALGRLPMRGVYFFYEQDELRRDSGQGSRVTRVGTHALKLASRSKLSGRLAQHRGYVATGAGNHRGSIFRLLIGDALMRQDVRGCLATWGLGSDPSDAAKRLGWVRVQVKLEELPLEKRVSQTIGAMPFLWLEIDDPPGPASLRGYIERNSIALLSNFNRAPLDAPSPGWLGHACSRERVRLSGLWNINHVDDRYDPAFLDTLDRLVREMTGCS